MFPSVSLPQTNGTSEEGGGRLIREVYWFPSLITVLFLIEWGRGTVQVACTVYAPRGVALLGGGDLFGEGTLFGRGQSNPAGGLRNTTLTATGIGSDRPLLIIGVVGLLLWYLLTAKHL